MIIKNEIFFVNKLPIQFTVYARLWNTQKSNNCPLGQSKSCWLCYASITGAGLRDKEITLAFPKMINHKLKSQELSKNFPLSTKNLMKELDIYDPIRKIFNAVSLPCNPTVTVNDFGYASPKSPNKASKIW